MNRPIKFRVWDKKNSQFLQNNNIGVDKIIFDLWDWAEAMSTCLLFPMDDYVFQQYTELKDKNDKEIYEGDIVKFSRLFEKERKIKELKSFVRFDEGKFGFDLIGFNGMFYDLSYECNIEVIGNTFEHSELLK
tara:strand:+ start:51 stop:449 length:399 start_codon:yes stop_codon:yes gene_type:complete